MSELLTSAFADKVVLVTGHTGFKGGWLSFWLKELGARVVGFSLPPPTTPSFFLSNELENQIVHIVGDVRNFEEIKKVIEKYNPEYVFHLAAQSLVRRSYDAPLLTFDTNIMGTVNVLEAIRSSKSVKVCICVTSDKCYENKEWVYAYRENDPMGGYDPYSASKGAAELVIAAYRQSFFNPKNFDEHGKSISSVRAGNVFGGGDWAEDRIVPDCIRALCSGKEILVRNPNSIRPWQFVLDPLLGYLMLAIKMRELPNEYASAWNFGPSSNGNIRVCELVNLIIKAWGSGSWVSSSKDITTKTVHESTYLKLDCTKAHNLLGWTPIYTLDEGIDATVEWYRAYDKGRKMIEVSKKQIGEFTEKAKSRNFKGLLIHNKGC